MTTSVNTSIAADIIAPLNGAKAGTNISNAIHPTTTKPQHIPVIHLVNSVGLFSGNVSDASIQIIPSGVNCMHSIGSSSEEIFISSLTSYPKNFSSCIDNK